MSKQIMASIGQLTKRFSISRSTLLYYERIDLLVASHRTSAGYRQYSVEDIKTLENILLYRSTGLSLSQLKKLLKSGIGKLADRPSRLILEQRLSQINHDIDDLRVQQRLLVDMLYKDRTSTFDKNMDKKMWSDMLQQAGLDERGMQEWHRLFEKRAPLEHQKFLVSLGLSTAEIRLIRENSKNS